MMVPIYATRIRRDEKNETVVIFNFVSHGNDIWAVYANYSDYAVGPAANLKVAPAHQFAVMEGKP